MEKPTLRLGAVHLQLRGLPLMTRADGRQHALQRKDAALLARLALQGPCARSVMAAWIWPDNDERQARSHLRQRLSRLTRLAGAPLFAGPDPLGLATTVQHDLADTRRTDGATATRPGTGPGPELLGALDYSDLALLDDWLQSTRQWLAAAHKPSVPRVLSARAAPVRPELDAALSISLQRPPRLVGREALWATLVNCCSAEKPVLLLGEPGAGKSRLLSDLVWFQQASLRVCCRPGDEQQPYALLTRLLRAALPMPAAHVPPELQLNLAHLLRRSDPEPQLELQPQRLPDLLRWALGHGAPATGRTVAVDDLQHADAASLETLLSMFQLPTSQPHHASTPAHSPGNPPAPLRWVWALRTAEVPPLLQAWLDSAEAHAFVTLQLTPLDTRAVRELVATLGLVQWDSAAWASTLHQHSGGNPLYLLQTLTELLLQDAGARGAVALTGPQSWALPSPQGALQLLERRIAQLLPPARSLLQIAALAGQDFDVALASAVMQQHPLDLADAWLQLEAAHLMQGREIAHDLVAEAAQLTLARDDAAVWHARMANHLQQHSPHDPAFARIAMHWRQAGHWPQAGRAFRQAAAAIEKQLRKTEEAALLLQAADCHALAHDVEAEAEALFLMFKAHWTRKHMPDIHAAMTRLQGLQSTPRAQLWAQITRAVVDFDRQPNDSSLQLMIGAQAQAQQLGDPALALWMVGWEVGSLALLNRTELALQSVPKALALIDRLPLDAQSCSALSQCGITLEVCGRPAQGLVLLQRAVALYRSRGEEALAAEIQCHQSICHYHLGQIDQASLQMQAGREVMVQINRGNAPPYMADYYQARYWREQGRLRQALELMLAVLTSLGPQGNTTLRAVCGIEAGLAYVRLGQAHRAKAFVELPRSLDAAQGRVDGLLLEAEIARAQGLATQPLLQRALGDVPHCIRSERWRWRVQQELARDMEPRAAIQLMQSNLAQAAVHQIGSATAPTRLMLLQAHQRAGDVLAAHQQAVALKAALKETAPMMIYAGEYFLCLAQAFASADDGVATRRTLQHALVWLEQLRREHVPSDFQTSFMERNPVNRQLLALAQRQTA